MKIRGKEAPPCNGILKKWGRSAIRKCEPVLDLLFPPRCTFCDEVLLRSEGGICRSCGKKIQYITRPYCMKCGRPLQDASEEYCRDCEGSSKRFIRNRSVLVYDDITRKAIYRMKYAGRKEYAKTFAGLCSAALSTWMDYISPDLIIPVPLHISRLKKRGFNQSELIADELSEKLSVPCRSDLVTRVRKTTPQKDLSASERQKNLKKAFKIRRNDVKLGTVLLVDDIYTTGSTLDELAGTLLEAGASQVYCITVSVGAGG